MAYYSIEVVNQVWPVISLNAVETYYAPVLCYITIKTCEYPGSAKEDQDRSNLYADDCSICVRSNLHVTENPFDVDFKLKEI